MEDSDDADFKQAWRVVEEGVKDCPDHGQYESMLMAHRHPRCQAFWTRCPDCNEVYEKEEQEMRERYEACVTRDPGVEDRLNGMILESTGIPPRYMEASLDSWKSGSPAMDKVKDKLVNYCASFDIALERGNNLIFIGQPGTGKTYAACCVIREIVVKRDHTAAYVTASEFLLRLRNSYGQDSEECEMDVFADYTTPSLLVLDEVGRHKDSKHASDSLFALLDRRYREVRPTIIISNMSKEEIIDYLGEALVSRLRQGGQMLGFYWEDQRK
jgi:DNA replication protein DnaC